MRIAMFYELDLGGARRACIEFAKHLKMNHAVDLYYVDEDKDNTIETFFNKTYFYKFKPKVWKGSDWRTRLYKDTLELAQLYNLHKRIAKSIDLTNYDYVFVHPSKFTQAPFLLRFLKTKNIYFCQEPLRIVYDPTKSKIDNIKFPKNIYELVNRNVRKWIDLHNFKKTSLILANSKYSKEFIRRSYGKEAKVCYLGVDHNLFKPLNIKKTTDVLFIGNKDKGYELLEMSKNQFTVQAIFRDTGMNMPDGELVKIYNNAKILVALNSNEPFGLIPLEAMACGIPVIAVDEGGYKESVVHEKTGYLIPRDYKKIIDKINFLLSHSNKRLKMGIEARKYVVNNWTWEKSVKSLGKIISESKL